MARRTGRRRDEPGPTGPDRAGERAPAIHRLDRYLLVVTPAEPLAAWVRSLGPDAADVAERGVEFTVEEAQAYHRTAYLVPRAEDAHDVEAWVEENFDLIFEQELFSFTPDRRRWPRKRTVDVFLEWFDLELLDAPIDLVDAPLVVPAEAEGEGA